MLTKLEEQVKSQLFFISYNNMSFYQNVRDQRLYNKAHIVDYIVEYICFMNTLDGSFFPYINYENVNYDIVNSLIAKNSLLDKMGYNHCSIAIYYILDYTLEKHFGTKLKTQNHVKKERLLLKYFN